MLIELGADATLRATKMSTTLHICAERNFVELCSIILKKFPRLAFLVDEDGNTPLHVACEWNSIDIVELLYEFGGGSELAKIKNNEGLDAIEYAYAEN